MPSTSAFQSGGGSSNDLFRMATAQGNALRGVPLEQQTQSMPCNQVDGSRPERRALHEVHTRREVHAMGATAKETEEGEEGKERK